MSCDVGVRVPSPAQKTSRNAGFFVLYLQYRTAVSGNGHCFFCACTDTQPVSFVAAMLQKGRQKERKRYKRGYCRGVRQRKCAATGIQQDNLKLKSNGQRDKPGGKAKGAKEKVAQMGNCGNGIGCGDVGGGRVFAEECGWEASGVL